MSVYRGPSLCICDYAHHMDHYPGLPKGCAYYGYKHIQIVDWETEEETVAEYPETDASAWGRQEGGSHYKDLPIQPSEYIVRNGLGWFAGNVVKYVTRHEKKGGVQDLRKARHYLDLLIEEAEKGEKDV